jgi:hypothetical protein
MSHRTFQFRLHDQPGQADATPVVERLSDTGVWEVQQSDLSTPPFRLSLISLLLCLRYHLVSEARDRRGDAGLGRRAMERCVQPAAR